MIGDFRTDALHEALAQAPIEDDTLMAMLVRAFAGQNVSVDSGSEASGHLYGPGVRPARCPVDRRKRQAGGRHRHASCRGQALSARTNRSDSGVVVRITGDAIGADADLPNMGKEEFLACLTRPALEACCGGTSVVPRPRVRDTRAALVEHFKEERFAHQSALFAPDDAKLAEWLAKSMEDCGKVDELPADVGDHSSGPKTNPRPTAERIAEEISSLRPH
nr:hypothetical protein [Rhizobium leguminosarum]